MPLRRVLHRENGVPVQTDLGLWLTCTLGESSCPALCQWERAPLSAVCQILLCLALLIASDLT